MDAISDDDYDRVSDMDLSDCESNQDISDHETPSSTPPSFLRPSDRKTIRCTYPDCPKTFNRNARLEEHLRSHTNSRIFVCDHAGCDKDFLRETHLKHHLKSAHSNIRDYKCTWEGCDKSFATGTRLRRHFQAHEGREKYRCRGYADCNQTFRKHETLKRHILQVHEQMKPFPCNNIDSKTGRHCDKAFDTAEKLRAHQDNKHDAARFSCTECLSLAAQGAASVSDLTTQRFDVFFATYSELQAHIAEVHPPTCPYCPTSFTTAKELTRHLEIQHGFIDPNAHGNDVHPCTYADCGRTFTKKGNLNVHVKSVHQKKKDFVCGETQIALPAEIRYLGPVEVHGCGRAFTTKATLEDHVRSAHLGMTSLQVERKNKRKAEKRDTDGLDTDFEPATRKPRKDKGVKKTSVVTGLTGAPLQRQDSLYLPLDPALANPVAKSHFQSLSGDVSPTAHIKDESDDESDDYDQLSGSMTMLGDRLYRNGEQYELTGDGYSPGIVAPTGEDHYFCSGLYGNASYNRVARDRFLDHGEEPFFEEFEHEPESMNDALQPHPGLGLNF